MAHPRIRKIRTFLIDDNEGFLIAFQMRLEEKGHQVVVFHDAANSIFMQERGCGCSHEEVCGDLLIVDQQMPGMTGLELIRMLTDKGCHGIIRHAAIMSGWLTEAEEAEARALNCEVFHKPFEFQEIHDWLMKQQEQVDLSRPLAPLPGGGAAINY